MSDTPITDAGARHVSVDRAGCITLWHSKTGGYVERALSEQLERENAALRAAIEAMPTCRCGLNTEEQCSLAWENAALRSIAAAMADEMEQHGGDQAFESLARYRAACKEAKP